MPLLHERCNFLSDKICYLNTLNHTGRFKETKFIIQLSKVHSEPRLRVKYWIQCLMNSWIVFFIFLQNFLNKSVQFKTILEVYRDTTETPESIFSSCTLFLMNSLALLSLLPLALILRVLRFTLRLSCFDSTLCPPTAL